MVLKIPRIRHDEAWNSPNVDSWRESLRAQVLENDRRITSQFLGVFNQVTDTVSPGGGVLPAASTLEGGSYYVLEVTGVFATANAPELNGQTGGAGDTVISDGTTWILLPYSQDFLSSVVDDTAAGVITFSQPAKGAVAAVAAIDLIRKQESDAGDAAVQSDLNGHKAETAAANDVHGTQTYTDAQDAAHAALQTDPDDVHGSKTYADTLDAALRSDSLAAFAYAAYGGLSLSARGVAGPTPGGTWQTITVYDTLTPARNVTQSLPNGSVSADVEGVYLTNITIGFTHNESNGGRVFELRIHNLTDGTSGAPVQQYVARNQGGTQFTISVMFDITTTDVGDEFVIQISSDDSFSSVLYDMASFSVASVGEYRGILGG